MPLILICENTWVFWSFDANNAANRLLRTAAKQNSDGCLQTAQNAISLAIDSVLIERHPQKQCASTPVIVDLSQGIIFLIKQADVCVKFYFCTTPLSLSLSLSLAVKSVGDVEALPRAAELRHSVVSIYGWSLRTALARCHSNRWRCLARRKGVEEVVAVQWGVHVPVGCFLSLLPALITHHPSAVLDTSSACLKVLSVLESQPKSKHCLLWRTAHNSVHFVLTRNREN